MSEVEEVLQVVAPILKAVNDRYDINISFSVNIKSKPSEAELQAKTAELYVQQLAKSGIGSIKIDTEKPAE